VNITILSNRDLASNLTLNQLLPELVRQHQVSVFLSSRVGGRAPAHPDLQLLKFFEQTLFTRLLFPALGERQAGAEHKSFSALGTTLAVPVTTLDEINSDRGLATLHASAPDLILSIRYGGILREAAIDVPRLGVLNLHSGLLPTYRGVMATFRAMLDGADRIGTTLHYIRDAGIDTGEIVSTGSRPVNYAATYLTNLLALYPRGCEQLLSAVATLAQGEALTATPQCAGGQYYSFPDEHDLQRFYAGGHRLYDVDEIAELAQTYLSTGL